VNQQSSQQSRSRAEWISFSISLSLVFILVVLVLYSWWNGETNPPVLSLDFTPEVRQEQGQYYVPFSVKNTGGGTAEAVQVIAELRFNGEVIETGQQHISFLSGGEVQKGVFIFQRNPQQGDLEIRVASYKLP
jgi:uncharacterized protein (TIGR02588 family)